MQKLSISDTKKQLKTLPGWEMTDNALTREYKFNSFDNAIIYIDHLAKAAGALNHHPEIYNSYNKVSLHLTTHSVSGVSDLDFELAKQAEDIANSLI